MTYYTDEDVKTVEKQRKTALIILYVMLGIFLIVSVGFIIWYRTLPYESPTISTLKLIQYPTIVVFAVILYVYCGIYLKRIRKRYKYQRNMLTGIKETSIGTFLEYSEEIQDKDGVEFKALIFIEWNKYKKDFFERKVLVFADRPFPEITLDAKVRYTTQSNVLIEYDYFGSEVEKDASPKIQSAIKKKESENYFD